MTSYRHLLVERSADGHVVTVTLNRPEQMNAMNTAMGEDLLACFDALHRDPEARVVVFTGAGDKAFCAGGDLKERNGMTDEAWRAQHVIFEQGAFRVLRCPIPVIAAVEGFALAGGCEDAAARERTQFQQAIKDQMAHNVAIGQTQVLGGSRVNELRIGYNTFGWTNGLGVANLQTESPAGWRGPGTLDTTRLMAGRCRLARWLRE